MLNGALILNKPSGISSGVFSRKVKKLLNQKEKVGHAGTLDPLADGVLIVCIGEMTKFISYLTDETKTYIAEIEIGKTSNTYDSEGDFSNQKSYDHITKSIIIVELNNFNFPYVIDTSQEIAKK